MLTSLSFIVLSAFNNFPNWSERLTRVLPVTRTSRGKETVGGGPSRSRPPTWGRRPGCPAPGGHSGRAVKRLDRTRNCGRFLTVVGEKKFLGCTVLRLESVSSVRVQFIISQAPTFTCTCTVPSGSQLDFSAWPWRPSQHTQRTRTTRMYFLSSFVFITMNNKVICVPLCAKPSQTQKQIL